MHVARDSAVRRVPVPAAVRRGVLIAGLLALAVVLGGAAPRAGSPDDGVLRIHLLWTNDVHGHIAPEGARFMSPNFPPPLGGAASAAAYIKRVREEAAAAGEQVLLVDVGDMFQGTPVGTKTQGTAVIDYFNHIGYDLAVPGNHDFDLGRQNTERLARLSKFPWLCANLVEKDTGKVVDWCRPTLMLERGGVKIGVIGIITPGTASMSFPANIKGLEFLPMPETVAKYRDELKAQGAQLIFLAIHEGLPFDAAEAWRKRVESAEEDALQPQRSFGSYGGMGLDGLVAQVSGIDFAVGGHTHRGYTEPWIDPVHHTICFESFGNGSSLGHAILEIDRRTGGLIGWRAPHDQGVLVSLFEDEIWPDEATTKVIQPWVEKTDAEMNRVVGRLAVNLPRGGAGNNLVGNLVTDAMREQFKADLAIQNLGGLRADMRAGDVTARDIFNVLPFGNELVVAKVPGELLLRMFERKVSTTSGGICVSGAQVVFNPDRPDGQRLCSLTIGGAPIEAGKIYTLVLTNYLMEGNSGLEMLTSVPEKDVEPTRLTDGEVLEAYLRQAGTVRPKLDDRWLEDKGCARAAYLPPAGAS
ncbi:MAG: bifunctional metallophosphatase/5'-nucleotidase [Candidatus Krumholzibacteriia bacterium]